MELQELYAYRQKLKEELSAINRMINRKEKEAGIFTSLPHESRIHKEEERRLLGKSVKYSEKGRKHLGPKFRNSKGVIVGITRNCECWKVVFENGSIKKPHQLHKSFCELIEENKSENQNTLSQDVQQQADNQ